jgi:hypothetical protein
MCVLEGYTAFVFCVQERHTGKLMDIQKMKTGNWTKWVRVANQGKGKKNSVGEDSPIRTINKNMKYHFERHLMQPNAEEEKWRKMWCKGKTEEK